MDQNTAIDIGSDNTAEQQEPLLDIKPRLRELKRLPPMPEMAQKIISLSSDVNADAKMLAGIIELDPSLAAQVMRYAASPLFAYQGKIDSVQTAVSRVLGFSMVMNLALGVTTALPFRVPKNLPLGLDRFWRHAVYSATLCQALSNALDSDIRPASGMAYLAGLLHNFGHLLLGHLFPSEFLLLNKFVLQEPERPVFEIEREVLGLDHAQIGAWLLNAWHLPDEVVIVAREHHNDYYHGEHSVMVALVRVVDHLLKAQDIGDGVDSELPVIAMQELNLGEYQVLTIAEQVLASSRGDLDQMARQLSR